MGSLINDAGISAAGERSLPLYWFVGYLVVPIVLMVVTGAFGLGGSIGTAVGSLFMIASTVALIVAWPFSALIVYWDCRAAERYADLTFTFGKVMALAAIVLGPAGVLFYLFYRILKFP